jgi:hypothetical protein
MCLGDFNHFRAFVFFDSSAFRYTHRRMVELSFEQQHVVVSEWWALTGHKLAGTTMEAFLI